MASAGVLVVTGAGLELRGVAPPLGAELLRAVEAACVKARAAPPGSDEEAATTRAIARVFWKARRPPPEIVVVRA
jgi:hypothetical protein